MDNKANYDKDEAQVRAHAEALAESIIEQNQLEMSSFIGGQVVVVKMLLTSAAIRAYNDGIVDMGMFALKKKIDSMDAMADDMIKKGEAC